MTRADRLLVLEAALQGDCGELGTLLDSFRPYLAAIGSSRWAVAGQVGESDLVQDALLEAHRNFSVFRGATVEESRRLDT